MKAEGKGKEAASARLHGGTDKAVDLEVVVDVSGEGRENRVDDEELRWLGKKEEVGGKVAELEIGGSGEIQSSIQIGVDSLSSWWRCRASGTGCWVQAKITVVGFVMGVGEREQLALRIFVDFRRDFRGLYYSFFFGQI